MISELISSFLNRISAVILPSNTFILLFRIIILFSFAIVLLLVDWNELIKRYSLYFGENIDYRLFEFRAVIAVTLIALALIYVSRYIALSSNENTNNNSLSAEINFNEKSTSIINEQTKEFERNLVKKSNELLKTENIEARISEAIENRISKQSLSEIGEKLKTELVELNSSEAFKTSMSNRFNTAATRAINFCISAEKQARAYRRAGYVFALIGIIVLGAMIYLNIQSFIEFNQIAENKIVAAFFYKNALVYLFILLSEFLALIMFRYASKSLEYMRYFSNEATNIDARHSAFLLAFHLNDKKALPELIKSLDKTERNFLIDKNQRTLETANNENEDRLLEKVTKRLKLTNKEKPEK